MFNNLIESSSHAKEFKRRGSFLLVTTATYLVLLVAGGVVSVYAYDAHLESQNTELEITFVPLREAETPPPPKNTVPADANRDRSVTESVRPVLYDSVNNPTKVPPDVSSKAQPIPPATKFTRVGDFVAEPLCSPSSGSPCRRPRSSASRCRAGCLPKPRGRGEAACPAASR